MINRFPYTDFQQLNLDWILEQLKEIVNNWDEFKKSFDDITANAESVPYYIGASVDVTGGHDGEPYNFDFKIPQGQNLTISGFSSSYGVSENSNEPPTEWSSTIPLIPQGYYLWTKVVLSFSDGQSMQFYTIARNGIDGTGSVRSVNNISPDANGNINVPLPQPSQITPLADTQYGDVGISNTYARGDHRHVSDASKLNKLYGDYGKEYAYGLSSQGIDGLTQVSNQPINDAIVKYSNNGTLFTNEPLTQYEVPRLKDVVDNFISKADENTLVHTDDYATPNDFGIVKPDNNTITVNNGILTASSSLSFTELYSNSDVASNFSAQTINADMSSYKFILVVYRTTTGSAQYASMLIPILPISMEYRLMFVAGNNYARRVSPSADALSLTFTDCQKYTTYNANTQEVSNNAIIPYKIYGVK